MPPPSPTVSLSLLKGLLIGFSIAAPVGPIGVLCIRRSLVDGRLVGFVTGLGAATADAVYGAVAAFGLTAISGFLVGQKLWLGLIGGAFLCYLGVRTFLASPPAEPGAGTTRGLASAYGSTLVLTVTNPATILSFVALFAGIGLGISQSYSAATAMVAGVFVGSALWWLALSAGVSLVRARFTAAWMRAVNRVSGTILCGFGIWALWKLH
jgi:threonine/homoserine/homoserine lactone efflux protein